MADLALQLIMQMEGFRSKAYWDRNAYRVGYGSDTWTDAEGKVHKVTKDTSGITRDQAFADLQRRVPEFQRNGIVKYVGQQAWTQLSPETQAAVTSLAYNYGSISELPSLKRAIKSGNVTDIASAIEARGSDNGGINKTRRQQEAALVTPLSPEVPPPPNRGTALGAIQALLGTSEPTAEAYAPASGSLTASALATGAAEPVVSRTLVDALRATKAQPVASGTATDVPSVPATDIAPVKAANFAPSSAVEPRTNTIQAVDLNPDTIAPRGPNGRGSIRPRETPRITEEILRPYAETYVPTKDRVAAPKELTTRKVTLVPVDPSTGSVAPKVSLQEALNRVAEKRRQEVVPVQATEMTFSEINKGKQPSDFPTIQPTSTTTTLRPIETKGVQVAEDLTPANLPPGYDPDLPFGAPGDLTRLTAQPGSPLKVPYGPPMPPKTVETAAPTPAPWMPRRQQPIVHADPSQPRVALTNPTAQEVVNGIGKGTIRDTSGLAKPTAALMSLVNSPNAQLVGQVNSGQHPIIGALMRMFGGFGQSKGVNGNLVNALAGTGNSAILAAQRDWLANASTEDRVTGSSPLSTYGYDPHTGTVH